MTRDWRFWVYIMASRSRHIYTGVTNDIHRRVKEHKAGLIEGFTRKYRINRLVYLERFHYVGNAIGREKEIKSWDRQKRVALIEGMNPTWEDLSLQWGKPVKMLSASSGGQQVLRCARDDNFMGTSTDGERAQEQQVLRCARDDNFMSAGTDGERAGGQQIPRFARDDNSDRTRSIGAELVSSNNT